MAEPTARISSMSAGRARVPARRPSTPDEELRRVVPVIRAIKRELPLRISVDTMKAEVASRRRSRRAPISVNDVSALADPAMLGVVRDARVPVIVMHMRGTPQHDAAGHRATPICRRRGRRFLRATVARAIDGGIADDKILVDPGLGFGKSAAGNLQDPSRACRRCGAWGGPLVIGASRKSFIGTALDLPVNDRLEGSLAVAAYAAWQGALVIRAHDVRETKRVTRMIDAIGKG